MKTGLKPGERTAYVHNATVDVAKLLQAEQPRAMGRVVEREALRRSISFPSMHRGQHPRPDAETHTVVA